MESGSAHIVPDMLGLLRGSNSLSWPRGTIRVVIAGVQAGAGLHALDCASEEAGQGSVRLKAFNRAWEVGGVGQRGKLCL